MKLPEKLLQVVDKFKKLPGVGEKTALRQSILISKWDKNEILAFANALNHLAEMKSCHKCGFFSDVDLCENCQKNHFERPDTICVVETVTDCMAIERSNQYHGKYFVLHGVLNPLFGVGPDELKIPNLLARIAEENISEVILAINPSVEGDATCSYINDLIPTNVKVERIGFGVPIGGSLEYLDAMTISMALENKRQMK